MNEQAKEARRKYKRDWCRANPARIKKYQENYWNKKAQQAAGEPANNPAAQTV